jgi:hypothetical protein
VQNVIAWKSALPRRETRMSVCHLRGREACNLESGCRFLLFERYHRSSGVAVFISANRF